MPISIAKPMSWSPCAALLFALGISGCSTNRVHSNVEDSHATMISASVIVRPEAWRSESGRRGQGGVEFAYEHLSGSGTQLLQPNEFIQYDGTAMLAGPQQINHDVNIDHGHIAYNYLLSYGHHFELEPAIGIAYDGIVIKSTGTAAGAGELVLRQDVYGITLGIIPRWNFNRFVGVEVPIRVGLGFASRSESVSVLSDHQNGVTSVLSPALVLRPANNVALSAGYTLRNQNIETKLDESNIDTAFNGPYAAIRVSF